MNPPDWTTLRIFLTSLECGSVTRAAEKCGIAVSAAAQRIRNLEAELDVQLLNREARGVTPTAAGDLVARYARSMLDQSSRLREDLHSFASGGIGSVRLSASPSALAGHPLAEALAAFVADQPKVSVELRESTSIATLQDLLDGRIDIGIVTNEGPVPAGLNASLWRTDQIVIVMPVGHPLAGHASLRFPQILEYPMIEIMTGTPVSLLLREAAGRFGVRLLPRTNAGSVDAAVRLVSAGHGIAAVPSSIMAIFHPDLKVTCVPLTEPWAERQLRLVSRPVEMLPPSARLLLDHLSTWSAQG